MKEDFKDKPHWVLRFNETGSWELVGPDEKIKHISGLGMRHLTVDLDYMGSAEFSMDGIFIPPDEGL